MVKLAFSRASDSKKIETRYSGHSRPSKGTKSRRKVGRLLNPEFNEFDEDGNSFFSTMLKITWS